MLVRNLLVPVLISALLAGLAAGGLVWRTSLARREALGATLQNRLSVFLQSSERLLLGAAALADRPDALAFLKESAPQFETIYRTDGAGRLVDVQPVQTGYLGMDFSNQAFVELPVQPGQVGYSPIVTSPLSGRQTIYLVTALSDGGRLSAELRLDALDAFLAQDAQGEGRAMSAWLLDSEGSLLARGGERLAAFGQVPAVGESRARLVGGDLVLVSVQPVNLTGWTMLIVSPLLADWEGFLPGMLGVLLLVPVLSAWLMLRYGRGLGRSMIQPLTLLNQRAQQISQGDYSTWVSFETVSSSFTEISELASSFQRMQQAIQQRQAALQVSESRFREMTELLPDMVFELDATRRIRYANRAAVRLLGEPEVAQNQLFDRLLVPDEVPALQEVARLSTAGQIPHPQVLRFKQASGAFFPGELALIALRGRDGNLLGYRGVVRDITERLSFEETLRRSYQLFTEGPVVVFRVRASGERPVEYVSPNVSQYGYHPRDFTGREDFFNQVIYPEDRARVARSIQDRLESGARFYEQEYRLVCANGEVRWVYDFTSVNRDASDRATHFDWYLLDITERKRAEERIHAQLQQLAALQLVDASITANADLVLTLQLLIAQLVELLGVDAAVVLRYNAQNQMLEAAAGRGFRVQAVNELRLRMGESYAGRAALRREKVILNRPSGELAQGFKYPQLLNEQFVSYCALPLVAKDEIKGVLEIFNRAPLQFDGEWMDFLETLAGQAAIAIYNADLLENLQRSNEELRQAYEATIRALSRALELRDKETEGHSQRVSDLAVRLARKAGVEEEKIDFVRIGALLHDIGKLGVPDQILHKEGQLTDEEWTVMRRHPDLARRMLLAIDYLRPALAIPQYHHERWNGSGYPYGLRGEDIPLAARVFAVVDVWDALSFDRPYRAAWPADKVIEYLNAEAGKQFDPRLVELFMQVLEEEGELTALVDSGD